MARFSDCVSCAFHLVEQAVCDACIEADQWEPEDSDGEIVTTSVRRLHAMKFYAKRNNKDSQ